MRVTANLKVSTFACSGKSSTNVALEASLEDNQASESLYNWLRPSVPARLSQASWGSGPSSWMLPLAIFRAMSEGLLATMNQEDDTELEEAAAPYD